MTQPNDRLDRIEALVESNSRAIQAMLDAMVEARLEREEFREQITRLDDVVVRLTDLQEGVSNLLASIDTDRPTILGRLSRIENKVDRLLENNE